MEFYSRNRTEPDKPSIEMFAAIGAQLGLFWERTRAEEQLRRTSANLERSNQELQQFAYVASHDLFEPLRMVTSYLQLLAERYKGKLDKQADEFIGFAIEGTHRMEALIRDLLAYSRVDMRVNSLEPVESASAFDAAVANLKVAIEETGATVSRQTLPKVNADPVQLTQLFQNLIGNGLKFHGPDPPRIQTEARRSGDEWIFSVRDNGIGIESKYFETIFVIFRRLHTRKEYSGTGIGLAICKKIVERHGGRIWVESAPGQGSTFAFTLPVISENRA
jgi:light-regulated signal transduction histidine kinase (bacteriophytochrome)